MTPERINQLLLIAQSNEATARGMRDGPWKQAMENGAAGIRELVGAVEAARLEGRREALAAASRVCRAAELAQRRIGNVETSAVGSRECALIIDEIDPLTIGTKQ